MTVKPEVFESRPRDSSTVIASYLRDSISLSEIADRVWSGRLIISICIVMGIATGIYSTWRAGPSFVAEMSLLPAEGTPLDGNNNAGGTLGVIAGLTGANLGSVPKFTRFLSALHSDGVAQALDKKYAMSCRIFRGDCDQKTLQWRKRTGLGAWFNGILASLSGLPNPNGPHTPTELARYISGAVDVTIDKTSQVVRLDYHNARPEFTAQFLSLLVQTTNDYIRAQDRAVVRQYVGYLANQATSTTNVAQRDAIDQLLLQEERKLMLTEVNVPYAASVLDGPIVLPVDNALKKITIYGGLGFVFGLIIVLGKQLFGAISNRVPS